MENWIYLLKVSGLLILFWLVYTLLLQKESFKVFNRFYLLLGIAISFGLPLYVFTEIEVIVIPETTYEPLSIPFIFTSDQVSVALKESFNPLQLVGYVYWIGVIFMSIKLLMQLFVLAKLMRQCKKVVIDGINHYQSPTPIASFSFLNSIFYHKESQNDKSLNLILAHEKEHISQKHSFDLLIANFLPVFLWFLPFAYAYRRAINENLEFLADASTLAKIEDKKQYQYTLLNATGVPQPKLVANFFFTHSSLKKRIMHINQSPSAAINKLKSLLILPFLFGFIYLFQTETQAMYVTEATPKETSLNYQDETLVYKDTSFVVSVEFNSIEDTITKDTTDEELDEMVKHFKEIMDIDVKIRKLKRNKNGEITRIHIKVEDKNANLKSEQKIESSSGIDPILVYRKKDETTDILVIAVDEVTTKINTSKFVGTKELTEILKDRENVYINGEKVDMSKFNVISSLEIDKVDDTSVYLIGDFVGSFENLREALKNTLFNASYYVIGNSLTGITENETPISVMQIKKSMSFQENKDINALQNTYLDKNRNSFDSNKLSLNGISRFKDEVLYMVNEKIIESHDFNQIDPNTIESLVVIKDENIIKTITDKDVSGIIKVKLNTELISPSLRNYPHIPALDDLDDAIFILNEKVVDRDFFSDIDVKSIQNIDIITNKSKLKKYTNKDVEKAIKIQLKTNSISPTPPSPPSSFRISNLHESEDEKAIYIVNGKVIDHEVIREIDPNTIESVEVIKDKEKVNAYTDKDVSGIIKINLNIDSISPTPPSPFLYDIEDTEMEEDIEDWILDGDKPLIKADGMEIGAMKINSLSSIDLTKNKGNLFFLDGKKMKDKEVDALFKNGGNFKRIEVITDKDEIKEYTKEEVKQVILLETK